jgi:flagellar biosynthesis/type III secretory pathway protein FliH
MGRVLRDPQLELAPINVPAPGAWDPVAQAAYEQGRADGYTHGYEVGRRDGFDTGRHELDRVADQIMHAATRCFDEVRLLHAELVGRLIEFCDLYVRTVVRGAPDASAVGLLARVESAIEALEPGRLELSVEPDVVEELTAMFEAADHQMEIMVVASDSVGPGEYKLRTEWAEADGSWDRYIEAAREAMTMYLVEHPL